MLYKDNNGLLQWYPSKKDLLALKEKCDRLNEKHRS